MEFVSRDRHMGILVKLRNRLIFILAFRKLLIIYAPKVKGSNLLTSVPLIFKKFFGNQRAFARDPIGLSIHIKI